MPCFLRQALDAARMVTDDAATHRRVVDAVAMMIPKFPIDVTPPEIVMHLPLLCDEKKIAYLYVPTKKELGEAAGIGVPTSAIAIVNDGDAKDSIEDIKKKVTELRK